MKAQVRIIGGKWRGRKLSIVKADGLRPTPDRIRETLFNWLSADCQGAIVLDCFAGSGVLGFEALSRGASRLVMLEQNSQAIAGLKHQAEQFDCNAVEIFKGDARKLVGGLTQQFNMVFIDPPYADPRLRTQIFEQLEQQGCLLPAARLYFEWPKSEIFELPSSRLQWLKHKCAGQVNYAIAEWQ